MNNIVLLSNKYEKNTHELLLENSRKLKRKKQRKHELLILSCYMNFDILRKTIKAINQEVRLTDIFVAFNFLELFKRGGVEKSKKTLEKVQKWCKKEKINFVWNLLSSDSLVHSKGYSIIQKDSSNNIKDGFVIVGSSNFTSSGYYGKNIELGYISKAQRDLEEFEKIFDILWDDLGLPIDDVIGNKNKEALQFSILSKGIFLHKWTDTLSQRVGIRYNLTAKAKKQGSIAPELAEVGFESGDTFTRKVLDMKNIPEKNIPASFIKAYTIETFLGRWCTQESWDLIRENNRSIEEYIKVFKKITTSKKLDKIIEESAKIEKDVIKKKLIEKPQSNHLENWRNKINDLRGNNGKLERIFMGYDSYELPYSIENKKEIEKLFDSLMDTIKYSKVEKTIVKKLKSAYRDENLNKLKLEEFDIKVIGLY